MPMLFLTVVGHLLGRKQAMAEKRNGKMHNPAFTDRFDRRRA